MRSHLRTLIERLTIARLLTCMVLLSLPSAVLPSASLALAGRPAVLDYSLRDLADVPLYTAAPIDRDKAAAEDEEALRMGLPYRFAIAQEVVLSPQESGLWESPSPLYRVWRLRIKAPGALSLNFGFTRFDLPGGSRLSIYPADLQDSEDPRGVRVFDENSGNSLGQLWTPVVQAPEVVVELLVPSAGDGSRAADREVGLVLGAINRGYRFFGQPPAVAGEDKSGSCNIDVVCPEGDSWRQEIDAVGVFTIGGVWKCTGTLLNNTSGDGTPYFLTAFHCGVSAENAPTMVVYWNFQSPECGQHGGGSLAQFQSGAVLRASAPLSDFNLTELADVPDPAFHVTYAGWDRRDAAPLSAVCIHQPSSDEKSISFENDPLTITYYLQSDPVVGANHLRVADWDLGTTEPGSSGSPLFDQNHHVVGQLHGGYAACLNDLPDWYGRFFLSWDGTEPSTRLRDWLDPASTGAETLDLFDPRSVLQVSPTTDLLFEGVVGGPFLPASGQYVLSNSGQVAIAFGVSVAEDWLVAEPTSGEVAPGAQVPVSVRPGPQAEALVPGNYFGTVAITNQTYGGSDILRGVTLRCYGTFGIAEISANPFVDYVTVFYSLPADHPVRARILDIRGMVVRDYGTLQKQAGLNEVSWDGSDDAGRRQPSGLYVLVLEAAGQRVTATLTHLH